LVAAKERFISQAGALPAEMRDGPNPNGGWGPIGILEHLVVVESGITSALAKEPNPERPRILGEGGRWPFWVVRLVLLTGIRIKAPTDTILPKGGVSWEILLGRWGEQRGRLEQWLGEVPQELLVTPRFKHPLGGWLNVRDTLTFAADHLQHHLGQLRRVEGILRRGPG
jgi:hypothetical protein